MHLYDPITDTLTPVATHDPARFTPPPAGTTNQSFITQDEESSGVIDATKVLGEGWWLLSDQIHARSADPEVVEGGQFTAMYVPQTASGKKDHEDHGHHNGDREGDDDHGDSRGHDRRR